MKKTIFVTSLALIVGFCSSSFAQNTPTIQQTPTVTVVEALQLNDDTPVVLIGTITQSLGDEKYQFTDNTGTVVVEIDDEDLNGINVNNGETVQIVGEVDKNGNIVEIDVDTITLKQ